MNFVVTLAFLCQFWLTYASFLSRKHPNNTNRSESILPEDSVVPFVELDNTPIFHPRWLYKDLPTRTSSKSSSINEETFSRMKKHTPPPERLLDDAVGQMVEDLLNFFERYEDQRYHSIYYLQDDFSD